MGLERKRASAFCLARPSCNHASADVGGHARFLKCVDNIHSFLALFNLMSEHMQGSRKSVLSTICDPNRYGKAPA